jgi:hypothetical protein
MSQSILMYRNDQLRPALAAMTDVLIDRIYSGESITRILAHAEAEGTLAGCNWLMPEDEAEAEAAFVDALPAIDYDSPSWGAEIDYEAAARAWGWDTVETDAPDADPAIGFPGLASLALRRAGIAPVAGGSPDYEPTAEDLADYGRWSEELEARRHTHDYLDGFNAVRPDSD